MKILPKRQYSLTCSPSSSSSSSFGFTVKGLLQFSVLKHWQNIEQPMLAFRHVQFPLAHWVSAWQLHDSIYRISGGITSTFGGSNTGSKVFSYSFLWYPKVVSSKWGGSRERACFQMAHFVWTRHCYETVYRFIVICSFVLLYKSATKAFSAILVIRCIGRMKIRRSTMTIINTEAYLISS